MNVEVIKQENYYNSGILCSSYSLTKQKNLLHGIYLIYQSDGNIQNKLLYNFGLIHGIQKTYDIKNNGCIFYIWICNILD